VKMASAITAEITPGRPARSRSLSVDFLACRPLALT
jgi:hypothetical protein